ncbi:hypothetical protein JW899_04210 [Candidatus Uhrbacteria bacterium]|nr:hypothetical protein [Candidatus Uhrbacteria bacterium]
MTTPNPEIASRTDTLAKTTRKGQKLLVCLALAMAAFLAGYAIGAKRADDGYRAGYERAWGDAKQKLDDSGFFPNPEATSVSGTITAIGPNYVDIAANPTVLNPLSDPAPTSRRVLLTDRTKIAVLSYLPSEEFEELNRKYQESFEAYVRESAESGPEDMPEPPMPPEPFGQTEINTEKLAVGTAVEVIGEGNIALSPSFEAISIRTWSTSQPEPTETEPEGVGPEDENPAGTE